MKTIWKFKLEATDTQTVSGPNIHPLSVGEQDGSLMMWATVDTSEPIRDITVHICGTGIPVDCDNLNFMGTVPLSYGGFVFHIFWS